MKVRVLIEKTVGGRYSIGEVAQVSVMAAARTEGMGEKSVRDQGGSVHSHADDSEFRAMS